MASLHQYRCFLSAYECGSFTAAAAQLGYAQPTLSEQIQLLERSLGVALFLRRGRGVTPTSAADALRPHAVAVLQAAADAERAVEAVSALESGTVRFGVAAPSPVFADVIAEVLEAHPGLRIEMLGRSSIESAEAVRRGEVEAALVSLPLPDTDLAVQPIAEIEYVYVSADPDRLKSPITARRLADATLVLPLASVRGEDPFRRAMSERVQTLGSNLNIRVEVEDFDTALTLARRGVGDSIVPRPLLRLDSVGPGLGWSPMKPRLADTLGLVYWKDTPLSRGTRLMIEKVAQHVGSFLRESSEIEPPAGQVQAPC